MTLELLGIEDSGAIPTVNPGPGLYGPARGFTLGEFSASAGGETRLRSELLSLIDRCTEMTVDEDDETSGILILRTKAHAPDEPACAVEYVDLIVSDRPGSEGQARVHQLIAEMGHRLMVDVERESINRPHAHIEGSNSFSIVRYAKVVLS
ncbi:hypothetical protein [Streptomyces sp. NPDC014622]|uniref:hypothetical protein n=1 Tax=Streptomyces sp. NPDC014622 TaxID=3364874 RepID=UPI0036FCB122